MSGYGKVEEIDGAMRGGWTSQLQYRRALQEYLGFVRHWEAFALEFKDWLPTPAAVNALPTPVREYVYRLETRCDPTGDLQSLCCAEVTVKALGRYVDELRAELLRLQKLETELVEKLATGKFALKDGCHGVLRVEYGTIRAEEICINAKKH